MLPTGCRCRSRRKKKKTHKSGVMGVGAIYTKDQIENMLRDYHWMVREIERIRSYLSTAGERVIVNYEGLDMPKPQGGVRDPIHSEVARREKQWRRMAKLEEKVRFIQDRIDIITDERERTVLDCMLDGMSFTAISYHMGLSKALVTGLKDNIVNRFYESQSAAVG